MDIKFKGAFIVLLRATWLFSLLSVLEAADVYMYCPAEQWVIGNQVTFDCFVLKTAYPSRCTSANREAQFRRSPNGVSYTAKCSLDDVDNICTSSSSDCTCLTSNSTHFNFKYTFKLAADSSGHWECNVPCLNGITPQLTYDSSAGCKDRNVTVGPCDGVNCQNSGTCYVDDKNQAKCDCSGLNFEGSFCEIHICDGVNCDHGKCYAESGTAKCQCHITYTGTDCKDRTWAFVGAVIFIFLTIVAVVIIVLLFVFIFQLVWKKKFSCVIRVIVRVDSERKKTTLQSDTTKKMLQDFVSEHFTLHCCCCCCCSWLGWCCSGKLTWRGRKGHAGDAEGGTFASSEGCSMGCMWCLSSVQKVEVDVYGIEDNQVVVLITLKSPLSWYSEAEDMPEKVKAYIQETILQEPVKSDTSKPSMALSVGYIAGSLDACNEPPADYPAGAPKAQAKYTGHGNGQPKKSKSDKAIPLSSVGRSSPPSETSGDEKTHMIPSTKGRALPVPANQHEPTSTGIGKSASPRLDPLTRDHNKMPSVERNSGAFPRTLPSPGQPPLDPIPSGKKS